MKVKKCDKGGRLDRRIGRKKRKLERIASKPEDKEVKVVKPLVDFNMDSSSTCPPGQKRNTKGSCETDNLKAKKSTVAKTPRFNPKKKRYKLRLVKPKKQKRTKEEKLKDQLAKLQEKKYKNKKRDHANPRFL